MNHGVTTSMYNHDPDNNQVELLIDNFATDVDGKAYMRGRSKTDKNPVGVVYEPDELVTGSGPACASRSWLRSTRSG